MSDVWLYLYLIIFERLCPMPFITFTITYEVLMMVAANLKWQFYIRDLHYNG